MRERTNSPKLCLLQLAADGEVAIIDPFKVKDLTPLIPLLENPSITKLFHAATQDLEILYRLLHVMPTPLFDTQIAAALLGYSQQVGYGHLVHSMCEVTIPKSDSFTDWSVRPLSKSQISYAEDDVIYLCDLYKKMRHALKEKGRLEWLEPDFEELTNPAHYDIDPYKRYQKLKRVNQLNSHQLSGARSLAAWREEIAMARNVPRKWILSDEQIVEASRREATTVDELYMVRGVKERLFTKDAREAVKALKKGLDLPEKMWPKKDRHEKNEPNVDPCVDLMMSLVRLRSKENDIAWQTLASHDDLVKLARGYIDEVDIIRGWRGTIVGDELIDLLSGKIALGLDDGHLVVYRTGKKFKKHKTDHD
ncbi:MAG: ribonuclease D, partial [Eggerthellaceae bacterium]|nr:ribonuclease D [Eggerthellaceae bacterium]